MHSNGNEDRRIGVARIDAAEIADHFDRWFTSVKEDVDAYTVPVRALYLTAYMTGYRAALETVTGGDLETAMHEVVKAVVLLDLLRERQEGTSGDTDQRG